MSWTIRSAQPDDRVAILALVREAFTGDGRDGQEEVDIVEATWALDAGLTDLELVAVDDAVDGDGAGLLGHVLGGRGKLGESDVVAVAPLGVAPGRQRQGIGSALMTTLLDRAQSQGWPAVVLLGDPGYYSRFGFEASGPLGIVYRPVGAGSPHFQVCRLPSFDPSLRGEVRYCWEPGAIPDVSR